MNTDTPRSTPALSSARKPTACLTAASLLLLAVGSADAAELTWDSGGVDQNWSTITNWVGDVLPVNNDTLIFSGTGETANNDIAANTDFSLNIASAGFDLTGNVMDILDNGTNDIRYSAAVNSGISTISLDLNTTAGRDFRVDNSGNTLVIDGKITTTNDTISIYGGGTLRLTNAANVYTNTRIRDGMHVEFSNGALGTGDVEYWAGSTGVIDYIGTGNDTVSNRFFMRNDGTIRNSSSDGGTLILSNTNFNRTTGNVGGVRTTTFDALNGNITVTGAIRDNDSNKTDPATYALDVTKTGANTLTLTGVNEYTGATAVNAGTLEVSGSLASAVNIADGATLSGEGSTTGLLTLGATTGSILSIDASTEPAAFTSVGLTSTTAGSHTVNFTASPTDTGLITILEFGGGAYTGSVATDFTVGTGLTTSVRGGAFAITGTAVTLSTGFENKVWDGTVDSVWDIETTLIPSTGTANWTGGSDLLYYEGDFVTFDDTATGIGGKNVVITGASVNPAKVNFNNSSGGGAYTLSSAGVETLTATGGVSVTGTGDATINTVIAGATSVTQAGNGTLTLNGANTYTGVTTISGGTLQANIADVAATSGALGNGGDITFTGGALQYTGLSNGTDYATRFKNSTSAVTLDTNGNAVTLAGIIDSTNTGGLEKQGADTLTLSGVNTYTGDTTVSQGTLEIGGSGKVGDYTGAVSIASGATYQYSSDQALSSTNRFRGGISGNGTFVVDTATGSVLSRQQEVSVANIEIKSGKFEGQANDGAIGTSATTIYLGDTTGSASAELKYSGGANTLTTKAAIIVQAGSSGTKTISSSPGEFTDNTDITLNGSVTFKPQNSTTGLNMGGVISGVGGLTLDTPAANDILTLTGDNTYTGNTTVTAGTLLVNGDQSTATGDVTVGAGAALGGSGTVGGATTINGTHTAATAGTSGTQTFSNNLTYNTSTITWDLIDASTSQFDQFAIDGSSTLDFAGGAGSITFNIIDQDVDFGDADQDFLVWSGYGTLSGFDVGDFDISYTGSSNTFGVTNGDFAFVDGSMDAGLSDGVWLRFSTPIPEPSTYALMGLGLALFGWTARRRRKLTSISTEKE